MGVGSLHSQDQWNPLAYYWLFPKSSCLLFAWCTLLPPPACSLPQEGRLTSRDYPTGLMPADSWQNQPVRNKQGQEIRGREENEAGESFASSLHGKLWQAGCIPPTESHNSHEKPLLHSSVNPHSVIVPSLAPWLRGANHSQLFLGLGYCIAPITS